MRYEAMFILKPDLSEDQRRTLFEQLNDVLLKHNGNVLSANIWSDKRKLYFPIKKYQEGMYYLVNFNLAGISIKDISHAYKLNENILRVLITKIANADVADKNHRCSR